jgi:hypothetical protein
MRIASNETTRKISWHCPKCRYLHVEDHGTQLPGARRLIRVKCIVCKEGTILIDPGTYKIHGEWKSNE